MSMGVGHAGQVEYSDASGGLGAALDRSKECERACPCPKSDEAVWPYVVAGLAIGGGIAAAVTHAILTRKGRRR